MRSFKIISFFLLIALSSKAQYPFEYADSIQYKTYDNWIYYNRIKKDHSMHFTLTIPRFFLNQDSLTLQLSLYCKNEYFYKLTDDYKSYIRIFRNHKEIQKIQEPFYFINNFKVPLMTIDINGDGLTDIKMNFSYMGCGNNIDARVIYLIQSPEGKFKKISFRDMLDYQYNNRVERDLDKDGTYELITMSLKRYLDHNYWTFDLFNVIGDTMINVNNKNNYPIMIQYLLRPNFKLTDKISKEKMSEFQSLKPEELDIK